MNRSRCGIRPISARNRTDLDAEYDRSRRGTGPISARVSTDLEPEPDRSRRKDGCARSLTSPLAQPPTRSLPQGIDPFLGGLLGCDIGRLRRVVRGRPQIGQELTHLTHR